MTTARRHHPSVLSHFRISDGHLQMADRSLADIVAAEGGTPLFVYDGDAIHERVAELRQSLPADMHISYAVKANPFPPVLALLAPMVDGFDVASAGELRLALSAGMDASCISFAGPGKSDAELAEAIQAQVLIVAESEGELARLSSMSEGAQPRVALRVNPSFELRQAGMRMSGGASPFGIDDDRLPQVLNHWPENIKFEGLHVFAGSQNLSGDALSETFKATFALIDRLADAAPGPLAYCNVGGGLGIPYFPGDDPLRLPDLGNVLNPMVAAFRARHPEARPVMELGRFLVGEAGVYVSRVLDVKQSRGKQFVIVDGGLHHHLAASGNFGQVIRRNYPVAIDGRIGAQPEVPQTVTGRLCTPLDVLWDNAPLPEARVGDLVIIFQSGAYGPSASPERFLGHGPARETLVCST